MSEFWIRFTEDGRTEGPLSGDQLKKLASRGYFCREDEIGKSFSGPWTRAEKVSQLEFSDPPEASSGTYQVPPQWQPANQSDDAVHQIDAGTDNRHQSSTEELSLNSRTNGEERESQFTTQSADETPKKGGAEWKWIVFIDRNEFCENKLVKFHNDEYPAISAGIRYYAVVSKLLFLILRVLWLLSFVLALVLIWQVDILVLKMIFAEDVSIVYAIGSGVIVALPIFLIEAFFLIMINTFYALSIAGCEAAVAFLSIEKKVGLAASNET